MKPAYSYQVAALVLGTSLLCAGCGSVSTAVTNVKDSMSASSSLASGPPTALLEFTPTLNILPVWQKKVLPAFSAASALHTAVDEKALYIATVQSVAAYDKHNGALLWQETLDEMITAGISLNKGLVVVGTQKGHMVGLHADTGKTQWVAELESEVQSISAENVPALAVRTLDGKLHALSPGSGNVVWSRSQGSASLGVVGASRPKMIENLVVAAFDTGKVVAYHIETGNLAWQAYLSGADLVDGLQRLVGIHAEMLALRPSALYASSLSGNTVGLAVGSGKVVWRQAIKSNTGITGTPQGIFLTDTNGHLVKLHAETGEKIWSKDYLVNRSPTAPVLVDANTLVVADGLGYIHAIESETGQTVARIKGSDSGYRIPPMIKQGIVYTQAKNGQLGVYRLQP